MDGCESITGKFLIVAAIFILIIGAVLGVSLMGPLGIIMGPIAVLLAIGVFNSLFS